MWITTQPLRKRFPPDLLRRLETSFAVVVSHSEPGMPAGKEVPLLLDVFL